MKKKGKRKAAHAASYIRAESFPPAAAGPGEKGSIYEK